MKMKLNLCGCLILLSMFLGSFDVFAQNGEKTFDINLWEKGLPNTNGIDKKPFDDKIQNYRPMIRVFLPKTGSNARKAVIAFPGGGYAGLAYGHEGYDWAPFFKEKGVVLIVLKYRMPRENREVPISDAEEAIRIVKYHAKEWGIDPEKIGVMGFSAGGHLASTIATHEKGVLRPAFQILFYPVISMDKRYTHMGSHDNLLGKNASGSLEVSYSNEKQVDSSTPRAFIALSDDDNVVPPINGVSYYLALNRNKIPASLHVYPSGGHGWGFNKNFKYREEMLSDFSSWLTSF